MSKAKLPIEFRVAESDADFKFIYDSWLKSLWPHRQYIDDYWTCQKWLIDHILDHSTALICCDKADPFVIFGYAIFDTQYTHWVYVKHPLRKMGLADELIDQIPPQSKFFYTHETPRGAKLAKKYGSRLDPYVAVRERIYSED